MGVNVGSIIEKNKLQDFLLTLQDIDKCFISPFDINEFKHDYVLVYLDKGYFKFCLDFSIYVESIDMENDDLVLHTHKIFNKEDFIFYIKLFLSKKLKCDNQKMNIRPIEIHRDFLSIFELVEKNFKFLVHNKINAFIFEKEWIVYVKWYDDINISVSIQAINSKDNFGYKFFNRYLIGWIETEEEFEFKNFKEVFGNINNIILQE